MAFSLTEECSCLLEMLERFFNLLDAITGAKLRQFTGFTQR